MKKGKSKFHHVLVIDESGSMQRVRKSIISRVNQMLATIRRQAASDTDTKHRVSVMSFNGTGTRIFSYDKPVGDGHLFDPMTYHPSGKTTIYDGLGTAIGLIRAIGGAERHRMRVSLTILTDGSDNGSVKFGPSGLKRAVRRLTRMGWTFTCAGSGSETKDLCRELCIPNSYTSPMLPDKSMSYSLKGWLARKAYLEEMGVRYEGGVTHAA